MNSKPQPNKLYQSLQIYIIATNTQDILMTELTPDCSFDDTPIEQTFIELDNHIKWILERTDRLAKSSSSTLDTDQTYLIDRSNIQNLLYEFAYTSIKNYQNLTK